MATRLVSAARTDVGLKRSNNEDNYILVPSQGLYILADGMGGHSSGQVASTMCVQHLTQFICETAKQANFELPYPPSPSLSYEANVVANAVKFANERVFIQSCKDRSMEGMGTTVTVIHNVAHGLILAHVGDSRIYRIRNKQITQLTRDHSLLNHLLDKGEIRPDDASNFANKNVILRAIGLKDNVDVEVKEVPREQGDIYLMCSDGLSDLVPDPQILSAIINSPNLNEACDKLIALALKAGGKDNVTVVCICIELEDGFTATPRNITHMQGAPQGANQGPHLIRTQPDRPTIRQPSGQASHAVLPSVVGPQSNKIARSSMPPAPLITTGPIVAQSIREHSVREPIDAKTTAAEAMQSTPRPMRGSASAMPAPPQIGKVHSNFFEPIENEAKPLELTDIDQDDDDETLTNLRPELIHGISRTLEDLRPAAAVLRQVPQTTQSNQNLVPTPLNSPQQTASNAGIQAFPHRTSSQINIKPANTSAAPPLQQKLSNSSLGLAQTTQTNSDHNSATSQLSAADGIPNAGQTKEIYVAPRRISRISKKDNSTPEDQAPLDIPSTELLLTNAPKPVEDFENIHSEDLNALNDERTILELPVINEEFLNTLEKTEEAQRNESSTRGQQATPPSFAPLENMANANLGNPHKDPVPVARRPEARHGQAQNNEAHRPEVVTNAPISPNYVPPKEALKAPVFDYDDEDDSIEIDASILAGSDDKEDIQNYPRSPWKR